MAIAHFRFYGELNGFLPLVGFSHRLRAGERMAVYPVWESLDITSVTRLRERPLRRSRFVADVHLGKLARLLRLLGFDTLHSNVLEDLVCNGMLISVAKEGVFPRIPPKVANWREEILPVHLVRQALLARFPLPQARGDARSALSSFIS